MLTARAAVLRQVGVFRGLDDRALRSLADRCQWREYAAGEHIILHQDRTTDVFFVGRGEVRATIYSPTGKEILLRDFKRGEMFGELAAIDGEPRSAHVIALRDCLIASMLSEIFTGVVVEFPEVGAATFRHLTKQVRRLCQRVYEHAACPVKQRIRAELIRLAAENEIEGNTAVISPVPTHAEIASRVSTHREAVTRELNELEQAGIIERTKGKLIIRDMDRLARMALDDLIGL